MSSFLPIEQLRGEHTALYHRLHELTRYQDGDKPDGLFRLTAGAVREVTGRAVGFSVQVAQARNASEPIRAVEAAAELVAEGRKLLAALSAFEHHTREFLGKYDLADPRPDR